MWNLSGIRYFTIVLALLTKYATETKTDAGVSIKVVGALNGDENIRIGEMLETVVDGYTGDGHLFYRYSGEAAISYGVAVYQYIDLDMASDGKSDKDGNMEYRIKPEDPEATDEEYPYTKITDVDMTFVPGTYEVRYAAKSNYDPSPAVEVTIAAGEKIKVILPEKQEGYTITSDASEIDYGESIHLTFTMDEGYSKAGDFAVKVNGQIITPDEDGTYTVENIQSVPEITVEGVKDLTAPTGSLTVAGTKWDGLPDPDAITFKKFLKDKQQVTIEAEDAGSGIDSVEYYLSEEGLTQSQLGNIGDEDWIQYEKPFDVNPGTNSGYETDHLCQDQRQCRKCNLPVNRWNDHLCGSGTENGKTGVYQNRYRGSRGRGEDR